MADTKIMTFLSHRAISGKSANQQTTEALIDELVKELDNLEGIGFSSFLNAISQTVEPEVTENYGLGEIVNSGVVNVQPSHGIVFHRDNLLYLIAKLIKKPVGLKKITGQPTLENAAKFYRALLLVNDLLSTPVAFERDYLIRAHPYYYIPRIASQYYQTRLQRYWYIYTTILNSLDPSKRTYIDKGIACIESSTKLTLKEYFHVVSKIYFWFLKLGPASKAGSKLPAETVNLGFDPMNIDSFYIRRSNFDDDNLMQLIDHLALDSEGFQKAFSEERKAVIEGFYSDSQAFFDNPIYKIDNDNYCIIDIKFLVEGLCSGFLWHLRKMSEAQVKLIKPQYGQLIELYFVELLQNIFGGLIRKPEGDGEPDAIIETSDTIILLEFTTEFYNFASLYTEELESFEGDVNRLLFNKGPKDPNARGKKDVGKFIKLNKYVENYKASGKKIVPVLVTENYLGDIDLLERFNSLISKGIVGNNLNNLISNKPTILSLDDFEVFWSGTDVQHEAAARELISGIDSWHKLNLNKGGYHYLFASWISHLQKGRSFNPKYSAFFDFRKIAS